MTFALPSRVSRIHWQRLSQAFLLILVSFAILWRGGRTLETTLLLSLVTVTLLLSTRKKVAQEGRVLPLWLPLGVLGFIAFTLLAYLATVAMNYGYDEVAQTVALGLLFLWMARQPHASRMRHSVLRVLVATVLVACLIGVVIYAFGPLNRFVGTFLDVRAPWKNAWPNAWAQLLLLAWPVALLFAQPQRVQGRGEGETLRLIARRCLPVGVMLGCLLLSFSRAAMVTFVVQIFVLSVFAAERRAPWKRVASVIACTFAVGLLIFGLSNYLRARNRDVQSLSEKALFLAEEGISSITERRSFWRQAWTLSLQRPLLGWGPGSFRFVQTPLMEDVLATSDHPHNVFLKVASERGWPASLLLLALLVSLFLPFLRDLLPTVCPTSGCQLPRAVSGLPRKSLSTEHALLFTAALGVIVHNLVDYNLQFIGISLPFVLILAMLIQPSRNLKNNKFVQLCESILLLGLLVATMHEGVFAVTSALGRRADGRGDTLAALRWYRWSLPEWHSRDLQLSQARLQMRTGQIPAAEATMEYYTTVSNTFDARGWKFLSEIARTQGQTDKATQSLLMAWQLGSYTDLSIVRQSVTLLWEQGGVQKITQEKQKIDVLLRKYYDAILRDSHFIALSSNVEEFLSLAELLSHIFPADEPRYQVMAAGVDRQAKTERLRLKALWQ